MFKFRPPQATSSAQSGNGLIEVLILIFIVSVGLLGMSKLNSVLVKEGSQTNSRSVATSLALAKIDDLKAFNRIAATPDTPCNAAGIFCYTEIANNVGGDIAAGDRVIGNTTYTLAWQNTDWYFCNNAWGNAAPAAPTPTCRAEPLHKSVIITVSWIAGRQLNADDELEDDVETITIQRSIFANNLLFNAAIDGFDGNTLPGPKVAYTPIQAPDAISIEIGGGKSTETAKPLPEVSKTGDSLVVTLPSVVFQSNGGTGQQLVSQEEFSTVNCSCKFDSTAGVSGYTPFRPVWDPTVKVEYSYKGWQSGVSVSAGARSINSVGAKTYVYEVVDTNLADTVYTWTTGTVAPTHTEGQQTDGTGGAMWKFVSEYVPSTTGSLVMEKGALATKTVGYPSDINKVDDRYDSTKTTQSPLCTACCRDHHDKDGEPSYRPYIASFTGNHPHYTASGAVAGANDTYVESCRMQRVDGYWRVVPDWLLVDLAPMNCDYFAPGTEGCPPTGTPEPTLLTKYRDRIRGILGQFVAYLGNNKNVSTASSTLSTFNHTQDPLIGTNNDDAIVVTQGGTKQLIARGLYADVIFQPRTSADPRKVDEAYYNAISGVTSNWDLLGNVRFYDANLTLLAQWSPTSTADSGKNPPGSCSTNTAGSDPVCVTNQAIKTIVSESAGYYDDFYTRGRIVGRLASGTNLITVTANTGNTGFTNSASIGNAATATRSGQLRAKISGSAGGGLYGTIVRANETVDLSKVTISTSTTGLTCTPDSPSTLNASSSSYSYSCSGATTSWTETTLTFNANQSGVNFAEGLNPYSVTSSPLSQVPEIIAYSNRVRIKGNLNAPNGTQAKNTTFAFTGTPNASCTATSSNYTCTVDAGWSGTMTPSLTKATFTPSSRAFTAVKADQLNQNFDLTATK